MMQAILRMIRHKSVSEPATKGSEAEYTELRQKIQREATNLSLASKIAMRSALLEEMIGNRNHHRNDPH